MATKFTLGILVIMIVIVIGLFFLHRSIPASAPVTLPSSITASTTPTTALPIPTVVPHTQPTFKFGTTSVITTPAFARFDSGSFTSTSTNPIITGTANIPKVGIIIYDSKDAGIVGTANIPVEQGRWTYYCSVTLIPGTYTLALMGGKATVNAKLIVGNP